MEGAGAGQVGMVANRMALRSTWTMAALLGAVSAGCVSSEKVAPLRVAPPAVSAEPAVEKAESAAAAPAEPALSAREPTTEPPRTPPKQKAAARGRGWLGIELSATSPEMSGVRVRGVVPDSPAASAGLTAGDVVLSVGDRDGNTPIDLARRVGGVRAGSTIELKISRANKIRQVEVVLGVSPSRQTLLRTRYLDRPAPELSQLKLVQGTVPTDLKKLRGKVVLIEFWASWCGVCRLVTPLMNDLDARFRASGVRVLGVTMDSVSKAAEYADALGMKYPVLSDEQGATTRNYGARALPLLFVIDKKGVVRDVVIGFDGRRYRDLPALVERLLAEG